MDNKAWSRDGENFYPISTATFQEKLETGVYVIKTPPLNPMYFQRIKPNFSFGYKLYGHNNNLINRVSTAYDNTTGNFGILLNGLKGTGKSVTAELICNKMSEEKGMPVILINEQIDGLSEILAAIDQDIVVFVDEFEKVFSRNVEDYTVDTSKDILTIMDGALKSQHRRLFVFTTNKIHINENLLQRPGRLRYVVQFKDLKREVIEEIVDDMLLYSEHRESTIEFISGLNMITVDIVKAIVHEVNMFNESPESFKDIFNVEEKGIAYNVYSGDVTKAKTLPVPLHQAVTVSPSPEHMKSQAAKRFKGTSLYLDGAWAGEIRDIKGNVITFENSEGEKEVITLEPTKSYHHNYSIVF